MLYNTTKETGMNKSNDWIPQVPPTPSKIKFLPMKLEEEGT
jgi:hypothetical protein